LFSAPPREERPELIDTGEPTQAEFAETFRDIARVNRFLGGTRAVLHGLDDLMAALPPEPARPVRVLDIATGAADIPRALVRAARRGRWGARRLEILATDNHPTVLALAAQIVSPTAYPEITIAPADAFVLPYPDQTFDIALCSLAFHHFGPDGCVRALREMARVTRVGFVVNDLRRDRVARLLIFLLTRIVSRNRLTHHDAPLSVLRAYTLPEYAQMAGRAGIPWCDVRPAPLFRAVLVARHQKPVGTETRSAA
jgi:ubiquinone/menaquinone biosynthesis C-methylase UbiE